VSGSESGLHVYEIQKQLPVWAARAGLGGGEVRWSAVVRKGAVCIQAAQASAVRVRVVDPRGAPVLSVASAPGGRVASPRIGTGLYLAQVSDGNRTWVGKSVAIAGR